LLKRSPGKSLKTLSSPALGGVANEVPLRKSPLGRGSEHFPGKLLRGKGVMRLRYDVKRCDLRLVRGETLASQLRRW
jgi:hypothetical protein